MGQSEVKQAPVNSIASTMLCVPVVLSPLLLGSTSAGVISVWAVLLAVGLAFADPSALRPVQRRWLWLVALVAAAYGLILLAQIMPPAVTGLAPHPLWAQAGSLLGQSLDPSVSLVRSQPLFAVGAPLVVLMTGTLAFIVGANRDRAMLVFEVVAWSVSMIALFAIISFLLNPSKLFWWDKFAYAGVLTTPFVNRNAAALYYGAGAVVGSLLFWQTLRPRLPGGRLRITEFALALQQVAHFRGLTRAARPVLCLVAVLLTGSRAGTVLALGGVVLGFTLYFWRDLPRRVGPAAALVLGGLIALIVLQTLGGSAGSRFNEHGLTDEGRMDTYRATVRMIADHLWLGSGLGTFSFAFPAYRAGNFWGVWDRAHNSLLEIAAEGGLPLALVVACAWAMVLGLLIHGIRQRRRDLVFSVAALTVATIALVHSGIDFSLQIPGFAIPVGAIVGVGAAQSFVTRKSAAEAVAAVQVAQVGPMAN